MWTQMVRTMNLGDAGRFSCAWTTSRSLLEELISTYSRPLPPLPPPASSQSPPPLLMLPRVDVRKNGSFYHFLNPVDKEFSVVRKHESLPHSAHPTTSSKGWVTFVNTRNGAMYLWDPLSDVHKDVLKLPSVVTLPCIRDIRFAHRGGSPTTTIRDFIVDNCVGDRWPVKLTKLVMTLINGSFSRAPDQANHCIALGYYGWLPTLHYSEIGGTAWKSLDAPLVKYAQVIASSKKEKLFFALTCPGEIEAWDLSDISNIKRTLVTKAHRVFLIEDDCPEETDLSGQTYYKKEIDYIVESSGDLLLITRYVSCYRHGHSKTIGFAIRRLNFGLMKWENINCLGGCAIFLGVSGECFSLRACDYFGLEENAIYFAPADQSSEYGGENLGVFHLGDNKIDRYYQLSSYPMARGFKSATPPPFWVAHRHLPSHN